MKCRARTAEDVEKAYREGENQGISKATTFYLCVVLLYMADKLGFRGIRLRRFMDYFTKYADMIRENDINTDEIRQILKEEYDIEVKVE